MELTHSPHGPQEQVLAPMWRQAPYPALTVDASGVVAHLNDAARVLLRAEPGARLADVAPGWLVRAHGAPAPVRGAIGERSFEASPSPLDGAVDWWLFDVTDHQRLARELEIERERTAFLAEASNELLSSLNLERCMEVTARLAAQYLADAALVITPRTGRAHPVTYCGPDGRVDRQNLMVDPADLPGLAEALRGFPPVPSRWIDPAVAPGWVTREEVGELGAMVVTALPGHGVPAGALVLLRRRGNEGGQGFSEGEEVFARLFAARAGAAMAAARLYAEQASISDTLMRELLPPRTHDLNGVELAARYQPAGAGDRVGGDFYDLYPATGDDAEAESLVVLGDVCGKGLEAAVLTGKIRNNLQALLPLAQDHQRVLGIINGVLLNTDSTRFVTLVLASVRVEGSQVRVRLTSAGHSPPLIVRADGRVEAADTRGSLIGVLDEVVSTTATVMLEPGETCLLYTDGITEAVGGPLGDEMFGDERLRAALAECGGMPPEAMVERVHMLASQWAGGGEHDDMAVIAITAPRRFRLSAVGGHGPGRFTA
ncbi:PP2C family protein-serine/threonine phosphatase [Actinomadura viridis]|uniref:Serine phosphatase RsbU (Regulator of sigma subunit) n=1 Tax=Actinomadura viridis TaxID=58110 RepID=A0A931DP13_9ACTN|nr:PP2C family protein-serine/threonine phosphatase [Actinomadura viridis]MBG6092083.1 serine phosphatase RsbU (regulator of sigma subunit) [Actinomadura viridis]